MRFQLALNVRDLDEAVDYYSKLFGAEVNKRKPGYANFSISNPPLKLVLFENADASERLNHVGFETFDNEEVERQIQRLEPIGLASDVIRKRSSKTTPTPSAAVRTSLTATSLKPLLASRSCWSRVTVSKVAPWPRRRTLGGS